MTLARSGAEQLIAQFGEDVEVISMDNDVVDDPDDPMFIDSSGSEGTSTTYKVRLYTTPSNEMLEDYGFEEDTEAIMYNTEHIATEGDKVKYAPMGYEWIIDEFQTNQIGEGPYIYVYKMVGL